MQQPLLEEMRNNDINKSQDEDLHTNPSNFEEESHRTIPLDSPQSLTNSNKPDSYRWVVLGCLICNNIANSIYICALSTIVMEMSNALDLDPVVITSQTLMFSFLFVPMAILSARFHRMMYPDTILRVCSIITIVMVNLRMLFNLSDNIWCLLIPSFFTAFCQAPVNSCIAQVPALWFPQKQQGIATGLCGLAITLGAIIGYMLPVLVIEENSETILPGLHILIQIQAVLITALCLVSLLFMRDKPQNLPTARAQLLSDRIEEYKRGDGIVQVSMPINYNCNLTLIVVFFVGLYSQMLILSVIVGQLLGPYYTVVEVAYISSGMIFFGLVGNLMFGFMLDRCNIFYLAKTMSLMSLFACCYCWFVCKSGDAILMCLGSSMLGFFMIPALPVGFQLAIRIEKPEQPAAYTGFIMMCTYLWSFCIGSCLSFVADTHQYTIWSVLALMSTVSFIVTWFIKPEEKSDEDDNMFKQVDDLTTKSPKQV